ncbi:MAG TPA: hypothetical protein VIN60_03445 [Anaerolineales bacterium]
MLSYNDSRWATLKSAYHDLYDPRLALQKLEAGDAIDIAWKELWNELHHQGDIDDASYVSVPQLVRIFSSKTHVDWNFYAFVSAIEIARHRKNNPPLPKWVEEEYFAAWKEVIKLAYRDLTVSEQVIEIRAILGALALSKSDLKLGALILQLDSAEIDEVLEHQMGWSELYSDKK